VADVTGHTNFVEGIDFSANGSAVATWGRDGTVRISKSNTGRLLAVLGGHPRRITGVAFDGMNRRVATASVDHKVRIFDAEYQPFLPLLIKLDEPLTGLDHDHGRLLVRGGSGRTYVLTPSGGLLNTRARARLTARSDDGSVVATVRGRVIDIRHKGRSERRVGTRVSDIAVSPDGRFAAAATGKNVLLWIASTNKWRPLRMHTKAVTSVDFSPDGETLLTGSRDDYVVKWATATRRAVESATPHLGDIKDVAYSPDSRWIVTAGPTTAGLLKAEGLETLFLLRGDDAPVMGAAIDARQRIFTVGLDGTVRRYLCRICGDLDDLRRVARERLKRFHD